MSKIISFAFLVILLSGCGHLGKKWPSKTHYKYKTVNGHKIFYREAGDKKKATIVLLHGFPSSSHTYRELIPMLSAYYHVIAPDNLGSGYSSHPNPDQVKYTFDLLAKQTIGLLKSLDINEYYLYMQDFGAPVGYRIALDNPEKIKGLIVQNANAYMEGLSDQKRKFFMTAGDKQSNFPRKKLFDHVSRQAIIHKQYLRDVPKEQTTIMSPDTWTHDLVFLSSRKDKEIQISLFQDYRTNLQSYPKWQKYLREHQPPTLILWGKHDPVFMHPGAHAYLKDVPEAELHLLEAGHFALEERPVEIAQKMLKFLKKLN